VGCITRAAHRPAVHAAAVGLRQHRGCPAAGSTQGGCWQHHLALWFPPQLQPPPSACSVQPPRIVPVEPTRSPRSRVHPYASRSVFWK
jgi:hypothetical protein